LFPLLFAISIQSIFDTSRLVPVALSGPVSTLLAKTQQPFQSRSLQFQFAANNDELNAIGATDAEREIRYNAAEGQE